MLSLLPQSRHPRFKPYLKTATLSKGWIIFPFCIIVLLDMDCFMNLLPLLSSALTLARVRLFQSPLNVATSA